MAKVDNLKPVRRGEIRNPRGSSAKARANAAVRRDAEAIVGKMCAGFISKAGGVELLFWEKFLLLANETEWEQALQCDALPYAVRVTMEAIEREREEGRAATINEIKRRLFGTKIVAEISATSSAPTLQDCQFLIIDEASQIEEEAEDE